MNPEHLVDQIGAAVLARLPRGLSATDVALFLATRRAELVATARQALPRQTATGAPVAIPWESGRLPDPSGQPIGRLDELRAGEAGLGWHRDQPDLAPGFTPPEHFDHYDLLAVQVSGGKDSVACITALRRLLAPRPDLWQRVELWHQDVDGGAEPFMDWPVTRPYVEALGALYGLPVRVAFREGGFYRELLRRPYEPRGAKQLETPLGRLALGKPPGANNLGRQRWPARTADLRIRWCSAELKIDVARTLAGYAASTGARRILLISGERAAESRPRAHYHRGQDTGGSSGRRQIHQLRLVLDHTDAQVWDELRHALPGKMYGLQPHPAYELGWSRCSCAGCIFSSAEDLARLRAALPRQFDRMAKAEDWLVEGVERWVPGTVAERDRLRVELASLAGRRDEPARTRARIVRSQLDDIAREIGRTVVPGKTLRERADGALMTLPVGFDRWRAFADGSEAWTVDHMLRGPGAPVFRQPWTLPAGASNPDSSGPPT